MSIAERTLTYTQVVGAVRYEPSSGLFFHLRNSPRRRAGDRAGFIAKDGYRSIGIDGFIIPEQRLAWFIMIGKWPLYEVDHRNHVVDDNRWKNLRSATKAQNGQHRAGTNRSKKSDLPRCVFRSASGGLRVLIGRQHVGSFSRLDDAVRARNAYEQKHRGEWAGA